jgi:hypothetical protein
MPRKVGPMRRQLLLSLAIGVVAVLFFWSSAGATTLALSPTGAATTSSDSVSLKGASTLLKDPIDDRIKKAVAECSKAWASKAGIPGYGEVVDALQGNTLEVLTGAIFELQDKVVQETYNNFIHIPVCAALVADLGINPNQLNDCPTGQSLRLGPDNEQASCQPTDYSAFDVPAAILGSWTGTITQQDPPIPPYELRVTILQGAIGWAIAGGYYTGDNCRVHWELLSADANRIVVNEVVHSGTCFNNVQVTLTAQNDGTLKYDFENGNGRGILNH